VGNNFLKKLSILLLITQFILEPMVYARAQLPLLSQVSEGLTHGGDAQYRELLAEPVLEQLEKTEVPMQLGLSADDPTLDEVPFFLQGQSWTENDVGQTRSGKIPYNEDDNSLSISLPTGTWHLPVPLTPILFNDEFIFLSAKENFQGFDKISKGLDSKAEGIFIISYAELLSASQSKIPVPVFFLPMPDHGWQGELQAVHFPKEEIVSIENSTGDMSLPLRRADILDVIQAERMNLYLAQLYTAGRSSGGLAAVNDLRRVIPAAKITAGFGTLFTGIDQNNPGNSLFALKDQSKIWNLVKLLNPLQKAEASMALDPKLAKRLVRVAVVISVALIASVVLRYTVFAEHFRAIRAKDPNASLSLLELTRKSIQDGKSDIKELWTPEALALLPLSKRLALSAKSVGTTLDNVTNRGTRPLKETGDVFAHTLTTVSTFAPIWFANTIEFFGDRYFPKLAAGKNTVIRKFLSQTVYFSRDVNDRLPVGWRTWLAGAVFLGGIDTFFVYVQLYSVIPFLGHGISEEVPILKAKVDGAFEIGNPNIANINQNETIRNAAGYITGGASQFSGDLQSQLLDPVKSSIQKEMMAEGKDPALPANETEFKARIEKRLDHEMVSMGSPSKDQFLFDASTLWAKTFQLLGYSLPQGASQKGLPEEKFRGLDRPGLIISSTKQAIKNLSTSQSPEAAEAISLLREARADMSVLGVFLKNPVESAFPRGNEFGKIGLTFKDYLRSYKNTRQSMLALTYEGDIKDVIEFVPAAWKGSNPDAISLAAAEFRAALSQNLKGLNLPEKPFAPPTQDFVGRWQERKAFAKTADLYVKKYGSVFDGITATQQDRKNFQEIYTKNLANALGLYPDYSVDANHETRVLNLTDQATAEAMRQPEVQSYFANRDVMEKIKYENDIYAATYIQNYLTVVVNSGDVPATSSARPGTVLGLPTQKWRQTKFLRQNSVLTRFVRGAEAFTPAARFDKGRTALLDRVIPAYWLVKQSNLRYYKRALTNATAVYAINYALYGMNLPAALWTLSLMAGWTIGAPGQFLNRFFGNQGWKPSGEQFSMTALFAVIYTWATFWGELPVQIFAGDFKDAFNYAFQDHTAISLAVAGSAFLGWQAITNRDRIMPAIARGKVAIAESYKITVEKCRLGLSTLRVGKIR
jgi:hypothetical protein